MEWSFASLFTSIRKCCRDLDMNSFCFLQEKIIYPLKGIRLLCTVFPHLVSLIPPSEHLSICNQHTMTLTNNNWTTTPHHNVVLITYITSYNATNVEQIHRAESQVSPDLHVLIFPLVHLLWSATPAEPNTTQSCVFCCNSDPQFKFWHLALISQKLTDAGSTQQHAENCVSFLLSLLCLLFSIGEVANNQIQ